MYTRKNCDIVMKVYKNFILYVLSFNIKQAKVLPSIKHHTSVRTRADPVSMQSASRGEFSN